MCMYLYIHSTAFGERLYKGPDSRPGMKPTRGNQMDSSPRATDTMDRGPSMPKD